jgi:glutathione reductase (NADPH)
MTKRFDLVVLGTGAAASTVAHTCREAGWQVAIVDSLPFGGTCAPSRLRPKEGAGWSSGDAGLDTSNPRKGI